MDDERRRDAALVDPVLVEPERRVRQVRPRGAVALVRVLRTRHARRVVAEVHRLAARACATCAIISLLTSSSTVTFSGMSSAQAPLSDRKMIDRVVELARGARARRRCGRCPGPCGRPARRTPPCSAAASALCSAAGHGGCVGSRVGQLPVPVQDAPLDQLVEARLAQRVPALVEAALVLRDVLVVRVQRPVRRGVGDVLEERRAGVLALVLARCRRRPGR